MLIQDKLQTNISPNENYEPINNSEKINNEANDANILVISTEDTIENKVDLFLDSNRRKFESEIGRDIVHERRMRKELMENSSSTGKEQFL